jgi:hypothetical protein
VETSSASFDDDIRAELGPAAVSSSRVDVTGAVEDEVGSSVPVGAPTVNFGKAPLDLPPFFRMPVCVWKRRGGS